LVADRDCSQAARPVCAGCGGIVHGHGRNDVVSVDLPVFGRPARLVWSKQRWRCPRAGCEVGTWCETDERIAPRRCAITDRAGRWATVQVGRHGEVWFDPELAVGYKPRGSWKALAEQYFEYGQWKAVVMRLHPDSVRIRQLLPSAAIAAALILTSLSRRSPWFLALPGIAMGALVGEAARTGYRTRANPQYRSIR